MFHCTTIVLLKTKAQITSEYRNINKTRKPDFKSFFFGGRNTLKNRQKMGVNPFGTIGMWGVWSGDLAHLSDVFERNGKHVV